MIPKQDSPPNSDLFANATFYKELVGPLQYLLFALPDLAYSVNNVCQHMHNPMTHHFSLVKLILRYPKSTTTWGQHIYRESSLDLTAYSESNWAGYPDIQRSTTGFCTFLGKNCLSWMSKKQPTVACSSTEAEYKSMAQTGCEVTWLSYLLRDLGIPLSSASRILCDNLSALNLIVNPVLHSRSKHVQID